MPNNLLYLNYSKLVHRFTTAAGLLKISDGATEDGFKLTFATNVLGHFSMVCQTYHMHVIYFTIIVYPSI